MKINYKDGIPERTMTLQYTGIDNSSPQVAEGTQIKLFVETLKERFEKEPNFIPIQRSSDGQSKGDKTQVTDTLKAKHIFEVEAYVYADRNGKYSLDKDSFSNLPSGETVSISEQTYDVNAFDTAVALGDTGIVYHSETVKKASNGEELDRDDGDYEINYARGEITLFEGALDSTEEDVTFGPFDLGTKTVINDELDISYDIHATANNTARLLRRMSQLGNPVVMRLDERDISDPKDSTSTERRARDYLVIPKKVTIGSKSENPAEYKIELELRKATTDR